jgi:hypothetical protein
MTEQHPITPPPDLVQQWEEQFLERPTINGCFVQSYIAAKAAQWGSDRELEACCAWLKEWQEDKHAGGIENLRTDRRPKPPSLKEQALEALVSINSNFHVYGSDIETIRRALETLDD